MAPTMAVIPQLKTLNFHHILPRASSPNSTPLTSIFALVMYRARTLAQSTSNALARSLSNRSTARSTAALSKLQSVKRQQQILVIPTTYANLRSSPAPGAVVGITLGAVFGFLLALFIVVLTFRYTYGRTRVVEEELVTRRSRRSHKQSASASSASDAPPIPIPIPEVVVETRRSSRNTRRDSRRTSRLSRRSPAEVIVEEELSSVHDEVIVEEEESSVRSRDEVVVEEEEDDIVEVIEEHSPEPPPRRKPSARRSATFRTVDPAEFGGGNAPSRRISRNTNRS